MSPSLAVFLSVSPLPPSPTLSVTAPLSLSTCLSAGLTTARMQQWPIERKCGRLPKATPTSQLFGHSELFLTARTVFSMIWTQLVTGKTALHFSRPCRHTPHETEHAHTHREGVRERVDISELTWEQKEQVLRLLFSKINEATPTTKPRTALPTSSR